MDYHLVVNSDFGPHKRGDIIRDKAEIDALGPDHPHCTRVSPLPDSFFQADAQAKAPKAPPAE